MIRISGNWDSNRWPSADLLEQDDKMLMNMPSMSSVASFCSIGIITYNPVIELQPGWVSGFMLKVRGDKASKGHEWNELRITTGCSLLFFSQFGTNHLGPWQAKRCLFFLMGHSRPLFYSIFTFSILQLVDKILPVSGFKPRISGVGSDRSTNWATTTAQDFYCLMTVSRLFNNLAGNTETDLKSLPCFEKPQPNNLLGRLNRYLQLFNQC